MQLNWDKIKLSSGEEWGRNERSGLFLGIVKVKTDILIVRTFRGSNAKLTDLVGEIPVAKSLD